MTTTPDRSAEEPAADDPGDDELLHTYARPSEHAGRWRVGDSPYDHSRTETLALIRSCLFLGVPVSDMLSSMTWWALVSKVADLERQIAAGTIAS